MSDGVQARVAEVFRLEYGRVVASVLRIVRDIDTAEEVVQEAFAQALDRWPADGAPERPGAWLLTTARRRALDRLRHARRAGARADALAYEAALGAMDEGPEVTDPAEIPDDRLRLIFTCCHPGLPADSRVALTLRLVGGPLDGGDRASLSRARAHDRPAARACQADDPRSRTSLRGARRGRAVCASTGRARRGLSDFQRGLRRANRRRPRAPRALPGGRPPLTSTRRADAPRARAPGAPRADGAPGLTGGDAHRRRRQSRPARRSGSVPLGSGADRPRSHLSRSRGAHGRRRALPAPGRHRRLSRARGLVGGDGLAEDRRPLPGARRRRAIAGGRTEPSGSDRPGARSGGRPRCTRRYRVRGAARLSPLARRARRFPPPARAVDGGGRRVPPSTQPRR